MRVRSGLPGVAWPGLPDGMGSALLALQFQLEHTQWWPPERLLEMQFRQIRHLAAHAVAQAPFYARHLERSGLASTDALNPDSFMRWPILTTREVQERQADLVAAQFPREHGETAEKFTTGSTGMPKRIVATEAARVVNQALVLRDHLWHRRDVAAKLCAIRFFASPADQAGWSSTTNAAFASGPSAVLGVSTDVDQQLEWLRWQKPAYLLTSPSNLASLVARSLETGRRPGGIRQVITVSEALPDGLRERLGQAWGASLADFYSCTEAGTLALQCPDAGGYHVQSEAAYVELLRMDGMPCGPGEAGRVVVTPLHNFAMPLLRYDIGDFAVAGRPCGCGRGLPLLDRVIGRVRNMARDREGRVFQPGFDRALEASRLPVSQSQFVQRTPELIEMSYVADRDLSAGEMAAFRGAVAELLPGSFSIAFRRVPDIPRPPGGKYEGFISLVTDAQQGG